MKPNFYEPNEQENHNLAEQIVFINNTVQKHFNYSLDQSLSDLKYIQKILDECIFSKNETWELQALGVVLGMVLVKNNNDLDWWIIEDEYGKDPTIRYKKTSFCINVLTMISKRIEKNELIDVIQLYDFLVNYIDENKKTYI